MIWKGIKWTLVPKFLNAQSNYGMIVDNGHYTDKVGTL
jgi:hypothetical protein